LTTIRLSNGPPIVIAPGGKLLAPPRERSEVSEPPFLPFFPLEPVGDYALRSEIIGDVGIANVCVRKTDDHSLVVEERKLYSLRAIRAAERAQVNEPVSDTAASVFFAPLILAADSRTGKVSMPNSATKVITAARCFSCSLL